MLLQKFRPIFIVLLTCIFALTIAAQNQERLVETLDIVGHRRLTNEDILTHIKTRPGDIFDEKRVKEDLQALLSLGLFIERNTKFLVQEGKRGGVHLTFEVLEEPLIAGFDFKGLKFVSKEELISELVAQNAKIEPGTVNNSKIVDRARAVILDYLAKRGFTRAIFWVTGTSASETEIKLQFHIVEVPDERQ
jgi:outer membrane protein assembly factor BamA